MLIPQAVVQEGGPTLPGYELAYVEITGDVSVTATVEASADTVVSAGAVTFSGTQRVKIEFFSPEVETGATAGSFVVVNLWDSSTDLVRLGFTENSAAGVVGAPTYYARFLTPTTGSHTYIIKAWRVNSNGVIHAGAGTAGNFVPAYVRVTVA